MKRLMVLMVGSLAFAAPAAAAPGDNTKTEAFFSQVYDYNVVAASQNPESIDRKLAAFIDAARVSLDAALFEIHNDNVIAALIRAHQRGVRVRLVSDYQYRAKTRVVSHQCPTYPNIEAAGIPIVYDTKTSLMHNKFLVRDSKCVWTGSVNTSDLEVWKNHNNGIKICNKSVAQNFATEFEEMFTHKQFGAGSPRNTSTAPIKVTRFMTVETCFAPEDYCGRMVVNKILAAQKSVYIMAFSVTDFIPGGPEPLAQRRLMPTIKSALLSRQAAGVKVWGVFEHKKVNAAGSIVPELISSGAQVRADTNPGTLHSKVMVIDGRTTIIGSFNFSGEADAGNDENMVVVNNTTIARQYLAEFSRIWTAGQAVPPPVSCDPAHPIELNSATQTAIALLPGMGWRGAQNVARGRPYYTIDDLYVRKIVTAAHYARIYQCLSVVPPQTNLQPQPPVTPPPPDPSTVTPTPAP